MSSKYGFAKDDTIEVPRLGMGCFGDLDYWSQIGFSLAAQ
jgi:hypothetical protein